MYCRSLRTLKTLTTLWLPNLSLIEQERIFPVRKNHAPDAVCDAWRQFVFGGNHRFQIPHVGRISYCAKILSVTLVTLPMTAGAVVRFIIEFVDFLRDSLSPIENFRVFHCDDNFNFSALLPRLNYHPMKFLKRDKYRFLIINMKIYVFFDTLISSSQAYFVFIR